MSEALGVEVGRVWRALVDRNRARARQRELTTGTAITPLNGSPSPGVRRFVEHGLARAVRVVAAATCLVGVTALAGCGQRADELEVGETVEGRPVTDGTALEVRVPSGTLQVRVGPAVASVTDGSREITAPAGGALVTVAWSLDRAREDGVTGFDQETVLSVVVDGEPTEVATIPDSPTPVSGSRLVAVGSEGPVEAIGADYDGVEQVLRLDGSRDAGVAEALYEPAADRAAEEDCASSWRAEPSADLDLSCTLRYWTLPYLPDAGWAPEDTTHVVVRSALTLAKVTDGRDQYRATFAEGTATLGAGTPASLTDGTGGSGSFQVRAVADSVTVPVTWDATAAFDLRSRAARGPLDGTRITLSGSGVIG